MFWIVANQTCLFNSNNLRWSDFIMEFFIIFDYFVSRNKGQPTTIYIEKYCFMVQLMKLLEASKSNLNILSFYLFFSWNVDMIKFDLSASPWMKKSIFVNVKLDFMRSKCHNIFKMIIKFYNLHYCINVHFKST